MVVAWGDSQGLKTVSRAPAAMKQVQGDKKRVVIPGSTRNRKIEVDEHCHCNPELESRVGIATRFPPAPNRNPEGKFHFSYPTSFAPLNRIQVTVLYVL